MKPRVSAVKIAPAKTKKNSWKPVKSKEPDCGSYDVSSGRKFVERSPVTHSINKISPSASMTNLKENKNKTLSKETFTTIMTN